MDSLSFALAAEIGGGSRSGAAIGMQQSALALASVLVPVGFALTVEAASWRAAWCLAALFPLAGWWLLKSLEPAERRGWEPVSSDG